MKKRRYVVLSAIGEEYFDTVAEARPPVLAQNKPYTVIDRRTRIIVRDRPYDPVALCAACIAIGWLLMIGSSSDIGRKSD